MSAASATKKAVSNAMPTPEQHGIKEHSDGRFGFVPVQTRSGRFKSVNVADFAPVTGREAVWRFSPVAKFTDLTAGDLDGSAYEVSSTDAPGISLIHISEPTRRTPISYAVFCLKKKKK